MKLFLAVSVLVLCIACALPLKIRTEFNPIGKHNTFENKQIKVENPQDIAIYIKSSPEGFTLKENEVQVKEGYNHVILGEIKVFPKKYYDDEKNIKQRTISALQQEAYDKGANAVIYCVLNVSENPLYQERANSMAHGLGSGWAVIVEDKYFK